MAAPADVDFDAVWTARTSRTRRGWTAEIAIPWQTLRYRPDVTTWGINFQRVTRRTERELRLVAVAAVATPFRMDYAGVLTGHRAAAAEPQPAAAPVLVGETLRGSTGATGNARVAGRRRAGSSAPTSSGRSRQRGAGRDRQSGLRADGRGSPGRQSDALFGLLPGAAAVLPREPRACSSPATGRGSSRSSPPHRARRRGKPIPITAGGAVLGRAVRRARSARWRCHSMAARDASLGKRVRRRTVRRELRRAEPARRPRDDAARRRRPHERRRRRRRLLADGDAPSFVRGTLTGSTTSGAGAKASAASSGWPTTRTGATWATSAELVTSGYEARYGLRRAQRLRAHQPGGDARLAALVASALRPTFRADGDSRALRQPVDGCRAGGLLADPADDGATPERRQLCSTPRQPNWQRPCGAVPAACPAWRSRPARTTTLRHI